MSIFAIGDLHLPGHEQKPMDVFGSQWDRHFEIISERWRERIAQDDIVLIPGDISWAMRLEDALDDLKAIAALPGRKLLLKGNHDYWWGSLSRLREALDPGMYVVQNDALRLNDSVFCGTRGWSLPTPAAPHDEQDAKILQRELLRLRMSLDCAMKLLGDGETLTVMTHYPPLYADGEDTCFTKLLERYPVGCVVYGHLHGAGIKSGYCGERRGIRYELVSCDALGFAPLLIQPTCK